MPYVHIILYNSLDALSSIYQSVSYSTDVFPVLPLVPTWSLMTADRRNMTVYGVWYLTSFCFNLDELQQAVFSNSIPQWYTCNWPHLTFRHEPDYDPMGPKRVAFFYKHKIYCFIVRSYVRLHLPLYHQNTFTYCTIFWQISSNTSSIFEPKVQK